MDARPTNSPRATVEDIVKAHGGLTLRGSQWEGACLCCGGRNRFHVNVDPGTNGEPTLGCRQCEATFTDHLKAAGLHGGQAAPKPSRRKWESWRFTAPDGRTRQQYRIPPEALKPGDKTTKKWAKPRGAETPKVRELLYLAHAGNLAAPGPVYCTEGGSSADSLGARCLRAIGFPGAHPSPESVERLPKEAQYVVWPDHDNAGYVQATGNARALLDAGLTVAALDPEKLCGGAPPVDARGKPFDGGSWVDAGNPAVELDAATVEVSWLLAKGDTVKAAKGDGRY